jgi:hypothetical protein
LIPDFRLPWQAKIPAKAVNQKSRILNRKLIWLSRRPLPPHAATGLPIGSRLKKPSHAS